MSGSCGCKTGPNHHPSATALTVGVQCFNWQDVVGDAVHYHPTSSLWSCLTKGHCWRSLSFLHDCIFGCVKRNALFPTQILHGMTPQVYLVMHFFRIFFSPNFDNMCHSRVEKFNRCETSKPLLFVYFATVRRTHWRCHQLALQWVSCHMAWAFTACCNMVEVSNNEVSLCRCNP